MPGCHKCEWLWERFKVYDIREADGHVSDKGGVYFVEARERRGDKSYIENIIGVLKDIKEKIKGGKEWKVFENYISNRISRLEDLKDIVEKEGNEVCPILYIGSSKNLRGRYKQLVENNGHTAGILIWSLLYHGWELNFGWQECYVYSLQEERLCKDYKAIHGEIPPLNDECGELKKG